MAENVQVQSPITPTPRPSSIATTISDRISMLSSPPPGSSSAITSGRNSSCAGGNPMTTTISTIAMQSGKTRIVIALLQSREWLQLKVLEMDPYITVLGNTVQEAQDFLTSHEDVLRKLQNKQSPVEELLRQADQLISTQKPRAEVYAAMADSLGLAWKDLNSQLEERKLVLALNVTVLKEIDACLEKIDQVEQVCRETADSIEGCKQLMKRTKDSRKSMLTSFLLCLEQGQVLIDKLEEFKSLDSRPDNGIIQAKYAISQVERWLEKLHDRRNMLDERFGIKVEKLKEEIVTHQLRDELLEVKATLEKVNSSVTDYGSGLDSVKRLLSSVQSDAKKVKELREKVFTIVREVDKTQFKHVSASKLRDDAFHLIDACNECLNNLEEEAYKLKLCKDFFEQAEKVTKSLDEVDSGIGDQEKRVNDLTLPLSKGQTLLNSLGWDNPKAKGVKSTYEQLLSQKDNAMKAVHEMEKARVVDNFLSDYNKLHSYLSEVDMFFKRSTLLGPELNLAKDYMNTLKGKLTEIESKQMVFDLPEEKKEELGNKAEELNGMMGGLVELAERRLELSEYYVELLHGIEAIKEDMKTQPGSTPVQDNFAKLESSSAGFFQKCTQTSVTDPGFKTGEACEKVKVLISELSDEIALQVEQIRRLEAQEEEMNRRISKAIAAAEEVIYSAYPILPDRLHAEDYLSGNCGTNQEMRISSPSPRGAGEIAMGPASHLSPLLVRGKYEENLSDRSLEHIEQSLAQVQTNVDTLDKELSTLSELEGLDEKRRVIEDQLRDVRNFFVNYKLLSINLSTVLKNLGEIDAVIEEEVVRNPMETEKTAYEEVDEILKLCREHADEIVMNIREMEPPEAGKIEEARLLAAIEEKRLEWDEAMRRKAKAIAARDLQQIEKQLGDLQKHLELTRGQYGESLMAARECSANFTAFEETIQILGGKIEKFIQHVDEDMRDKAGCLKENWTRFLQMTKERRRLIDLSLQYFTLVNEAETWFKDGSKLLITIARKSASVKTADEADQLLKELEAFVKPGELKQDERIAKISTLAAQLYGEEKRKLYDAMMIKENKEILDSLNSMNNELSVMASHLRSKISTSTTNDQAGTRPKENEQQQQQHHDVIIEESSQDEQTEVVEKVSETGKNPVINATTVVNNVDVGTSPVSGTSPTSVNTSIITEKVIMKELNTNTSTLERIIVRPVTPTMMEKETQFESLDTKEGGGKSERDTVTQTVDEKLYEKETQTEKVAMTPPAFTTPLNDIASNEGEKIRFQCVVEGQPKPQITWLKDGLIVTQANSDYKTESNNGVCSLTIDETFVDDSSIFTCRAANDAGVADTSAKLVVKETQDMLSPPKFEVPLPQSTKLIEGTVNHQFSCLVRGNPLPTVEWFKNDVNVDTCADYIITFNNGLSVFKFGDVILEDEGVYTCKASNKAGEASTSTELLVEARSIRFLEPLSKKTMARTGHKLKLECRTNIPCEFEWLHDNKPIRDNIKSDKTSSILVINEAFAKDAGHYVVIARNEKLGENKCSCQVTVKGKHPNETSDSEFHSDMEPIKPRLKMALEDAEAQEGDKVRLDCIIVGHPEPEVIWYHNNKPVKESKDFQLVFRGDKCSLIVRNVVTEDEGEYRVTAINSAGEASSSCKLKVLSTAQKPKPKREESGAVPPKFSKLIEDTMVNEGEEVILKCSISEGTPEPRVKWFKNAIEIKETQGYSISSCGKDHELKILNALPEHRGNYMAKAINEAGEVKCFACLIVKSPLGLESPPAVKKLEEQVDSSPVKTRTDVVETTVESSAIITKRMSYQHKSSHSSDTKEETVSVQDRAAFFNAKESPTEGVTTIIPMVIKPRSPAAPRFVSPLNGVMADEGAVVVLEGQIDGHPEPSIKWTKNDADFDFEQFAKSAHGRVTLELRNVKITDGGRYTCIAENNAGIATSIADVVIKKKTFPPVFGKRLQAQTIQKNKRLYMEVEVIGTPAPDITWFKDGAPIDRKNKDYEFRNEGNRHILICPQVTRYEGGQYMVKASNEAGNAQSIADVIVLDEHRKSPATAIIFESTVGITEELGAPKPVTLIYETRSMTRNGGEKSHCKEVSKTFESTTMTTSTTSGKSIPMIVKTQPTIPYSETFDRSFDKIPNPVLESPRLVSPTGKPMQPIAVKVEEISVTSEPLKSPSSGTHTESRKSVKQMTSQFIEQSSTVIRTSQTISPKIDVSSIPSVRSRSKKSSSENNETSTRIGSETPTLPPAPRSTPETGPTVHLPMVPDSVLKSMELAASVCSEASTVSKTTMHQSETTLSQNQIDLVPGPPPEICYTPKPGDSPRKSYVSEKIKQIEHDRRKLSIPDLPGAVRILPPDPPASPRRESPTPLKRFLSTPSPSPKDARSPEPTLTNCTSEPELVLEPFPFTADDSGAVSPRVKPPPPPKPKKFVPSEFRESDYESDFDTKIQPVWRPSKSAFVSVPSSNPPPNVSIAEPRLAEPPTLVSSHPTIPATISNTEQKSVKKLIKSWPPAEPNQRQEETQEVAETKTYSESQEEIRNRSVKEGVSFFEKKEHSKLTASASAPLSGKVSPSPEALAMDKLWSRPVKRTHWPPSEPAGSDSAPESRPQSVNYYVSTVSSPRTTPLPQFEAEKELGVHRTLSTYESKSSYFESHEVTTSESAPSIDKTTSPTVITDRGFKPSDAKKAWPPFLPDAGAVPKPAQPSWMQAGKLKQRSATVPSKSAPSSVPKPGSPPLFGYAPFPASTNAAEDRSSIITTHTESSSYESQRTIREVSSASVSSSSEL